MTFTAPIEREMDKSVERQLCVGLDRQIFSICQEEWVASSIFLFMTMSLFLIFCQEQESANEQIEEGDEGAMKTSEQMQIYQHFFNYFDTNCDGHITSEELMKYFNSALIALKYIYT